MMLQVTCTTDRSIIRKGMDRKDSGQIQRRLLILHGGTEKTQESLLRYSVSRPVLKLGISRTRASNATVSFWV
jgi:hypothetical protein